MTKDNFWSLINKRAFFPPAILLTIGVIIGAAYPTEFGAASGVALSWITEKCGWIFTLGSVILFVFCMWAAFSKYGRIKLGGPNAKPIMNMFQWFAVAFTACMAIGIIYFCVAEPLMFFKDPPTFLEMEGGTPEAATVAMRYAYHHWAFVPFAIYTSAGIAIAFLFHNCGQPFRVSSSLVPLIGKKATGNVGSWVDALCTFSMVGGISTSLGIGTLQITGGLEYLFGINSGMATITTIIVIMGATYTFVATTGIHKGIKHLGTFNMYLYFVLLLFVLFAGPTRGIIEIWVFP